MDNIRFHIIDWDSNQDLDPADESNTKKYFIRLYGITDTNKTIFVNLQGFTPYFYVAVPNSWSHIEGAIFVDLLSKRAGEHSSSLKTWDFVQKSVFYEFNNYRQDKFIRLIFHNHDGFREFSYILNKPIYHPALKSINKRAVKYKLYESNIDPILRCMHIRNIQACGWAELKSGQYSEYEIPPTYSNLNLYTSWYNLTPYDSKTISPLIIASYDIECTSGDGNFPQANRDEDKIIQIGTTFSRYGEPDCFYKHIITLGKTDNIPGVTVESYESEIGVLLAWTKLIRNQNPDIITGFNRFGFDDKYLKDRAIKLNIYPEFSKLGRVKSERAQFITKTLESKAMGTNYLYYFAMQGRIQFDIMKQIQRDYKLNSYKLDDVAAEFIKESILAINLTNSQSIIKTKNTYGLELGRYIKIYFNDGLSDNSYKNESKFKIIGLTPETITLDIILDGEALKLSEYKLFWCQAKDDVHPTDIFKLQTGSSSDRRIIAQYCIQDCELGNKIINKLQIITNCIGMSNVTHVPLSFIFLRGQGIKIFSLVAKKCREKNFVIPVIRPNHKKNRTPAEIAADELAEKYEGACVFDPIPGIYYMPITVLDYNSLYPNSMRYRNLSHECLVENPNHLNLPDYYYETVIYNNPDNSQKTCIYAVPKNGNPGILPEILKELLDARSDMRKLAELEKDNFQKKILDGKQLAYKLTANSLYGQMGSSVSPLYRKDIAASTTAIGKEMLNASKIFSEYIFKNLVSIILSGNFDSFSEKINLLFDKKMDLILTKSQINKLKSENRYSYLDIFKNNREIINRDEKFLDKNLSHKSKSDFISWFYSEIQNILKNHKINPAVIYGDTDSIFINYGISDNQTNKILETKEALNIALKLGPLTSKLLGKILPNPQFMVYEKSFYPFIILTKKKYIGNKYESDPNKWYQASMGIVLKRRDNAPIVKIVVGGIVKNLLNIRDKNKLLEFIKKIIHDLLSGRYPLEKFIITRTLKAQYKNRTRIVHAVLADRIARRDPGNAFQSSDRVPYAYIEVAKEPELQGDRVEHPDYIIKNKLKLDYLFYLTNQIMKPAIQFLNLVVDKPEKIFQEFINREINRRKGTRPISYYIKPEGDNPKIGFNITNSEIKPEIIKKPIRKARTKKNLNNIKKSNGFNINSEENPIGNLKYYLIGKKLVTK